MNLALDPDAPLVTSPERGSVVSSVEKEVCVLQAVSSAAWGAAGGLAVNLGLGFDPQAGAFSPVPGRRWPGEERSWGWRSSAGVSWVG